MQAQSTMAPAPAKHHVVKHRVVKKAPKKVKKMHHVRVTKTTKTTTKAS